MSKQYDKKFTKKQVEACFKRFDLNSDGMVTTNELRIVIEKLGRTMTQKQLEDMVKAVDKDRSGGLSIEGKIHDARLDLTFVPDSDFIFNSIHQEFEKILP